MATINITIPDGVLQRVLDAVALEYHYDVAVNGTKAQFAKAQVIEFLKRTVRDAEGSVAIKAAKTTSDSNVESGVAIT